MIDRRRSFFRPRPESKGSAWLNPIRPRGTASARPLGDGDRGPLALILMGPLRGPVIGVQLIFIKWQAEQDRSRKEEAAERDRRKNLKRQRRRAERWGEVDGVG